MNLSPITDPVLRQILQELFRERDRLETTLRMIQANGVYELPESVVQNITRGGIVYSTTQPFPVTAVSSPFWVDTSVSPPKLHILTFKGSSWVYDAEPFVYYTAQQPNSGILATDTSPGTVVYIGTTPHRQYQKLKNTGGTWQYVRGLGGTV